MVDSIQDRWIEMPQLDNLEDIKQKNSRLV